MNKHSKTKHDKPKLTKGEKLLTSGVKCNYNHTALCRFCLGVT